jgi:hypothetical protein
MENIELKVAGQKLILTVDLTKEVGRSSSGVDRQHRGERQRARLGGREGGTLRLQDEEALTVAL